MQKKGLELNENELTQGDDIEEKETKNAGISSKYNLDLLQRFKRFVVILFPCCI